MHVLRKEVKLSHALKYILKKLPVNLFFVQTFRLFDGCLQNVQDLVQLDYILHKMVEEN